MGLWLVRLGQATLVSLVFALGAFAAQTPDRALVEALRAIYQLSDYSAFDWITGSYQKGTLRLQGVVRTPQLKARAAEVGGNAPGVEEVVNDLDVLPTHSGDDEIRLAAYVAIYGSAALERYAPGGQLSGAAIRELQESARFGLDAVDVGRGPHAIHILVSGGRLLLRGQVRTTGDRRIAEATVRTIPGVLAVTNELRVSSPR